MIKTKKVYLPHKCETCGLKVYVLKDKDITIVEYVYHEGFYYHYDCFMRGK